MVFFLLIYGWIFITRDAAEGKKNPSGPTADIILYFDNIYIYILEGRGSGDGGRFKCGNGRKGKEDGLRTGGGSGLATVDGDLAQWILGVRREAGYVQLYRDTRFVRALIHDMGSRSSSRSRRRRRELLSRGAFTYSAGDLRQLGAISGHPPWAENSRSGGGYVYSTLSRHVLTCTPPTLSHLYYALTYLPTRDLDQMANPNPPPHGHSYVRTVDVGSLYLQRMGGQGTIDIS